MDQYVRDSIHTKRMRRRLVQARWPSVGESEMNRQWLSDRNILGDIDRMPVPGIVTFTLKGQEYQLEPVSEAGDDQYWFIFRDLTSQKETYPAARFLYAAAPVNGKMTLDFNRTINPPCAYNPYTTCPLPTAQNRLRTRIEAGEKRYEGEIERKK